MKRPRFFYGYVVVASGFVLWLVGWGTYSPSFSLFLKPLLSEFGWSRAETSLAYSLSMLVQAILGIVMGWLTDKLGPRIVIGLLGSSLGLCYLLMSQIQSLWQFQLNYILLGGLGSSTITIPIMATISRWFIKKRALMIGLVQTGNGISGFIFPPLIGGWIVSYGWRPAYLILGTLTLVSIVTSGLFVRRDPADVGQLPDSAQSLAIGQEKASASNLLSMFSVKEAVRNRQFWVIAGLFGAFGFYRSAFLAHFPAHVQDLGFSLKDGATVLALLIGSSMFGRIGTGRLTERLGIKAVFMMSFTLTVLTLTWGLVAHRLWMLYLFGLAFGFGWGNQAVLRFALAGEVFGMPSLGLVLGTLTFVESIAAMTGTFLGGYIFDLFGSYRPLFWIAIGTSLAGVSFAGFLKLPRNETN